MMKLVFFLCVLSGVSNLLHAQEKPFIRITDSDGLPGNQTKAIFRDSKGFLWVGTDSGLCRYDGTSFLTFNRNNGLPGNNVWTITEGNNNCIYVGCYNSGIVVIKDEIIIDTLYLKVDKMENSIRLLHNIKDLNTIVIGSDYGVHLLRNDTVVVLEQPLDISEKLSVLDIVDYDNIVYFTAHYPERGLFTLSIDTSNMAKSVVTYAEETIPNRKFTLNIVNDQLISNAYYQIYQSPLNSPGKLSVVADIDKAFLPWCSCMTEDDKIIYGGWSNGDYVGGLRQFQYGNSFLEPFASDLKTDGIFDLYYDNQSEIVWAASSEGLLAFPNVPYETISLDQIETIRDVIAINDTLYILGKKGLYLNVNGKIEFRFSTEELEEKLLQSRNSLYSDYLGVPSQQYDYDMFKVDRYAVVNGLIVNKKRPYIYSNSGSIEITEKGYGEYLPFEGNMFHKLKGPHQYFYIPPYRPGRYYPNTKRIEYDILGTGENTIKSVNGIIERDSVFFFSSFFGGMFAKRDSLVYNLNEANSKIDNNITSMDISPDGDIWCTSSAGNLFNIEFQDSLYLKKIWNENNSGLKGSSYKWLKFSNSFLFIGTNKFLFAVPVNELRQEKLTKFFAYNEFNGFPYTNEEKVFSDINGTCYMQTESKVLRLKDELTQTKAIGININTIEVDDQPSDLSFLTKDKLNPSTKKIALKWSLLKYPTARNVQYYYRINNNNWNQGNSINLEPVSFGTYKIEVKAVDLEAFEQFTELISLTVRTPLFKRLWFILTSVLTLILTSYFIGRLISQKVNERKIERLRIVQANNDLRIRSMQRQMNPHFMFNALTSIQSLVLDQKEDSALKYLSTFGKLVRSNLEHISMDFITVREEVEFLKSYINLEEMRFETLSISLRNRIHSPSICIPPMMVQPLIENSIKHGISTKRDTGKVIIDFKLEDDLVIITVEDNGIGRQKSKAHNIGLGLKSIHQRIDLLNQKNNTKRNKVLIYDLSAKGKPTGTKVVLLLESSNMPN